MNDLQSQGRACYRRGDYQRAIEYFDRAIGRAASVQLLDNRAACYEKLQDLQNALKDAKQAIQLHREDATGYLRAGKILVKMEKHPVALEIYSHGLKCIKHHGQGYQLLRTSHRKLMDKLSPPKSVDPMTVLPRELAIFILEHLSFRQLMNACLVSKPWSEFIRSYPDLWRHLDLSQNRRKVRSAFISRAINVGRKKLTAATLSNLYDFDKALAAIIKHCQLDDLSLLQTGLLGCNLAELLTPARHLKRLCMSSVPQNFAPELPRLLRTLSDHLEIFEYSTSGMVELNAWPEAFPMLHTLSLECDHLMTLTNTYPDVSRCMPSLTSLRIHAHNYFILRVDVPFLDLAGCSCLLDLDLRLRLRFASQLILPPTLVKLKLSAVVLDDPDSFWDSPGHPGLGTPNYYLPKLEELDLEISGMHTSSVLSAIANKLPKQGDLKGYLLNHEEHITISKLRKLAIRKAVAGVGPVSRLLGHSRLINLQELHLPSLSDCGDEEVDSIMETLPKLKSLDLTETKITGVGVRCAVQSGHLRELIVNDCHRIAPDAIEWARQQGVKVEYRMADRNLKGRKVRH